MTARASRPRTLTLFFSILAALAAAFAFSGPALAAVDPGAPAPAISSDQADYAPGSLVTLAGSNWAPGETVHIYVNDDQGKTWERSSDVIADANGAIEDQFNLPDWFVATYAVSATGPSSGTATASFTDGNVKISSQTGTFGYTTTMYPNSTNCTGTAQAPQTATATTTQQNLGAGGTGQSVLLEANLLNSANQSFVNWITPSGGDPVTYAPGYSAADRITCIVGFSSGSHDIRGIYAGKSNQTITFAQPASPAAYNSTFPVSASASSGLPVTIAASGTCTLTSGTVTMTSGTGTCTLTASQGGNAQFNAAANVVRTVTASKLNQSITFGTLSGKTFGDPDFAVSATASSGLAVSFSALGDCDFALSGNVHITGAGSCTITASQAGDSNYNAATAVPRSFTIAKAAAALALSNLSHTYDGSPKPATVTTTPSGLSGLTVTYDGLATAPENAGSYAVVASLVNANYTASDASGTLVIAKASQTISFGPLADKTFGDAAFAVSATGGDSANPVTFVAGGGNCTSGGANGATITITGAGSCTVTADQAGNANYDAATSVVRTFQIEKAESVTSVTCPASVTYTGSARTPCTASVTGAGGLDESLTVTYTDNTNAGTAHASASFAGDANHTGSSDSATFAIQKAASVTSVSCPATALTYNGSARTPCSASVTGAGGLDEALTVSYTDNTNAGTAHASANFAGDDNHTGSSDAQSFTIDKAASATSVTCPAGSTYTGSAQTPCTATATGAGGLDEALTVSYTDNTNAGTAHASASFAGDANHTGSADAAAFTIAKAASTTSVSCPATALIYNGSARTPCTASVTGAGGLDETLTVTHTDNTNAGTGYASASFAGDDNHTGSSDSQTFTIDKAAASVAVTWADAAYYGGAHPASASVTGPVSSDNPIISPPVSFTYYAGSDTSGSELAAAPQDAGTYTVVASFAGNGNYNHDSATKTISIAKAASTTSVSCPAAALIYNGSARTPCTASVTGAGGLDETLTVTYTDNTNAGTAHASASFAGDDNHTGSTDSATFSIDKAASATSVTCPASTTYTGSAQTPCTASATGAGGLNETLTVAYTDNTNAGTAHASASFAGDDNHTGSADAATFAIDKAVSLTSVSCPATALTYNGSARTPCTASVTGAGGLDETLTVTHADNINAGTGHASASFAGDDNHTGSSDSQTFTIEKADADVAIDWTNSVYDGAANSAAASVTGPVSSDNPITSPAVSFAYYSGSTATGPDSATAPANAGTYTVVASFAGNGNYNGDSATKTISIAKAASTTSVSCPATALTYNGSARTPCTASVTGAGGLDETLTVTYSDNTNAGTGHASASFAGDDNHTGSTDAATFTIEKAGSATTVTCPAGSTYTGSAQTPCTATATGAGGLSQSLPVSYTDNTNAGTAHAAASFAGDANHTGSTDAATFTIDKAASLTSVSCPAAALIYNGSARTPCSATVTGAGGLSQSLPVSYTDNTNAGTGHASASFAGDDNHTGSTASQTFTIDKAVPAVTITWAPWVFDGAAHPATGSVGGVAAPPENLGTPTFVYYSGSTATGTPLAGAPSTVGTYTVLASFAGNANYKPASATKTILVSYVWSGFLQPINDTAHQTGLTESKFKLGQTIPAKFVIKNAAGTVVQQSGSPTFSRSGNLGSCDATAALETITEVVTPDAGVVYNWDGSQYHYNWSTKGLTAGEYRVYANLGDGSKKYVDICLTK